MKRQKIVRRDVAHVWAHKMQGEARTPGGKFYFSGDTIYSYGSHFPIARHVETKDGKGPAVLFTTHSYSPTTSGHIRETRHAIPPGVRVFDVSEVCMTPGLCHLNDYAKQITEAIVDAQDTKKRTGAFAGVCRAESLVDVHNKFSAAFKLRKRIKLPKNWAKIRDAAKERYDKHQKAVDAVHAREAQDRAEGYKRQLVAFDDAFKAWKGGKETDELPFMRNSSVGTQREKELSEFFTAQRAKIIARWIAGESVSLPYGYGGGPDYLRIKPSDAATVETTRHVEVERGHVERVLPVVLGYIRTGKTYQRNGHTIHVGPFALEHITAGGDVHVGCHRFARAEVLRFASELTKSASLCSADGERF